MRLADHPAVSDGGAWLVCGNPRCATVLAPDAEICDECAGTQFEELYAGTALLCGWADERPVAFRLTAGRPLLIGRSSSGGQAPDIDLRRFPNSASVHRRHATIELRGREWSVTHLGTNPLVIRRGDRVALKTGASTVIRPGDALEVGGVALLLVVRASLRRI